MDRESQRVSADLGARRRLCLHVAIVVDGVTLQCPAGHKIKRSIHRAGDVVHIDSKAQRLATQVECGQVLADKEICARVASERERAVSTALDAVAPRLRHGAQIQCRHLPFGWWGWASRIRGGRTFSG
mgnify:CR=1 FL=1